MPFGYDAKELLDNKEKFDAVCRLMARVGATPEFLAEAQKIAHLPIVVTNDRAGTVVVKAIGELTADDLEAIADHDSVLIAEDMARDAADGEVA